MSFVGNLLRFPAVKGF